MQDFNDRVTINLRHSPPALRRRRWPPGPELDVCVYVMSFALDTPKNNVRNSPPKSNRYLTFFFVCTTVPRTILYVQMIK